VYYVGLFLLNEAQRVAVLRAATGEAGKLLLEMGYNVDLGDTSTVARCITHRQARISSNAREDTLQFDALAMPHARSEIALPLRSRGRILGALSMASTQEDAFSEGDIAILQTMADQVAVAIDNAVLYSQTKTALEQLQAVQQRYMAQAWSEFLATRPVAVIDYTRPEAQPVSGEFLRDARRAAVAHERTVATSSPQPDDDGNGAAPGDHADGLVLLAPSIVEGSSSKGTAPQSALVVPIKLRGQVIGTMALHETDQQRLWTAKEIELAETVAEQVALTVENLRLMDETQRRAAHERLVSEIVSRVWSSLDPDTILKTTVRELGRALGAELATVEMIGPGGDGRSTPGVEPERPGAARRGRRNR
jgi:GAF domain-containing protein